MRQLLVQVPRGHGAEALALARAHEGVNLARFDASDGERPIDLVIVHVSTRTAASNRSWPRWSRCRTSTLP